MELVGVLQTPEATVRTYKWEKTVLFKDRLFFCFVVDFFLRSFLFTHIEIVFLTTNKYFLHRASLFLL